MSSSQREQCAQEKRLCEEKSDKLLIQIVWCHWSTACRAEGTKTKWDGIIKVLARQFLFQPIY